MANDSAAALSAGHSETRDHGQRVGRSMGGHLVQLRRRIAEPGFVVTVDAEPRVGATTELITTDWAAANTTFSRFMHEY